MKHFKQRHFAIIPLLSILAMSPGMVQSKYGQDRSIASVKEEVKPEDKKDEAKKEESKHPKYDAAVAKVKPEDVKDVEIAKDKLAEKETALFSKLNKDLFTLEPTESLVAKQRKYVESGIVDVLLYEGAVKKLADSKTLTDEEIKSQVDKIEIMKGLIEDDLTQIEANEAEVAKAKKDEPKKEDKPVVAEEPKKEDKPVVAEKPKEEPKKEEAKKEEKKEAKCEFEEQNKVLSKQVEDLMKQNQQILQSMLGMSNMMVGMYQQMQSHQNQQAPNPYYQNGPGWNQSPYQYVQPQTAGNWVYYPQGFQPQQTNIFAPQYQMPSQQQQAPVQGGGFYPDQVYGQQPQYQQQQQAGWQLNADPRYQIQGQFTPGTFGSPSQSGLGFNMGQNSIPAQTPILGQTMPQGQQSGMPSYGFTPRQF